MQLTNFDASNIKDLRSVMIQMQSHLRMKTKSLEKVEEANFFLESTVKRENEKLKNQNQKLSSQMDESEEDSVKYKEEAKILQSELEIFKK